MTRVNYTQCVLVDNTPWLYIIYNGYEMKRNLLTRVINLISRDNLRIGDKITSTYSK